MSLGDNRVVSIGFRVFDAHHIEMLVAWIITNRQICGVIKFFENKASKEDAQVRTFIFHH